MGKDFYSDNEGNEVSWEKIAEMFISASVYYHQQGRDAEALPFAKKGLLITERNIGENHPDLAVCLNNLAEIYRSLGEHDKAEPLFQKALAILEKAFGPDHAFVATILNNLGGLYDSLADYVRAEPLFRRSLAIRERTLGPVHPDLATSLNNLAGFYCSLGEYAKAEPLYQRALAIVEKGSDSDLAQVGIILDNLAGFHCSLGEYAKAEPLYLRSSQIKEKALGPDHPDVGTTLHNLALLYSSLGEYTKAESLYQRALAIGEKALGPNHRDVGKCLHSLAGLYHSLGEYAKAEHLYQRALAIAEKALGPEHPEFAIALTSLAVHYSFLGEHAKAEHLYQRALAIAEKAFGPEHPHLATTLGNIAGFYDSIANYPEAEHLYQKALAIREKTLGPQHPDVAKNLNNLAAIYCSLGDYTKAKPMYQRALAIRERKLGSDHTEVAESLNNLGWICNALGDYANAESMYQKALAIKEKALGPEHPKVGTSLHNLAVLYSSAGEYTKAEPMYQEALAIKEKALGPEHPDVAIILDSLAGLYRSRGDLGKAEPLYRRSLAIRQKALGPQHLDVATSLNNLAILSAAIEDFQSAYDLMREAHNIDTKVIGQIMGFTSEDQKTKFLAMKIGAVHAFLSLVKQHFGSSSPCRKSAFDVWLKRKGVILEAERRFQETLADSGNPAAMQILNELVAVRARLSNSTFTRPGLQPIETYRRGISVLEIEKERLESKLSRLSQTFAQKKKVDNADSEQIARAVPPNTAMVDFARLDILDFKSELPDIKWLPARYFAFVLHADRGSDVSIVELGDAEMIDEMVTELRLSFTEMKTVNNAATIRAARNLHDLVFAPLKDFFQDAKEIFISPDGNLNLIPFEVLQNSDGSFLIEDYVFNYLAASRDLLRFESVKKKGNKALLIGDPDFDMVADEKRTTFQKLELSWFREGDTKRSTDMEGFRFTPLPGAKEEVEELHNLLGKEDSEVFIGKEAAEELLMQMQAPSILHLATHGFFLTDVGMGDFMDRWFLQSFSFGSETPITPPMGSHMKAENPLLRSGIALAGANQSLKSENAESGEGILTSEKILGLRLRGTDMVVLSACDTGVGEVKNGEGVYGLRRAFTQAGAKSVVMSLWKVRDRETKELMLTFYKNIQSGMNRCQALRQAALSEMQIVKKRYGTTHPFFWGGFIFMGEP